MERTKLKKILLNYYKDCSADSILRGIRRPAYAVLIELNKKHNIPFDVWLDIKSYLKNNTKNNSKKSNLKINKEVS